MVPIEACQATKKPFLAEAVFQIGDLSYNHGCLALSTLPLAILEDAIVGGQTPNTRCLQSYISNTSQTTLH